MAITTSGTSITFNDATTQTTAAVNPAANVTSATAVAGTGISVTAVTTTGAATHTVTNTGVTSVTAGTGISVSASTGAVTISASSSGGVTSLNGQTGAITNTTFNTIGSYVSGGASGASTTYGYGSTTAGSNLYYSTNTGYAFSQFSSTNAVTSLGVSGTWRAMARVVNGPSCCGSYQINSNLWVRIS